MEKSTRIANPAEVQDKKWYLIDAEGKTLGKVSVEAARILRGKGKVCFTAHQDLGDFVVIINAAKIALTGNKLTDKKYYRHSGYPGGFKEERAKDLLGRKPENVLIHSVKGMLPKNKLSNIYMTRLRIYSGAEHQHQAQSPQAVLLGGRHGA
jgi:large subunit ribosomal protein L13